MKRVFVLFLVIVILVSNVQPVAALAASNPEPLKSEALRPEPLKQGTSRVLGYERKAGGKKDDAGDNSEKVIDDLEEGLLEDHDITLDELAADCYLGYDSYQKVIERLYDIDKWPSEVLVEAAKDSGLYVGLTVNNIAHLPSDISIMLDDQIDVKDAYLEILFCLLLKEEERFDDSEYKEFKKNTSWDLNLMKKITGVYDTGEKISDLSGKEKKELEKTMKEYMEEDSDFVLPAAKALNFIMDTADTIDEAIKLYSELKALCSTTEENRKLTNEIIADTKDLVLFAALKEVSTAMDGFADAMGALFVDSAVDVSIDLTQTALKEVYKMAMPEDIALMIQLGTGIGDAVTAFLFANGKTEDCLTKLDCVGALARVLISTSKRLGKQYESDKAGNDIEKRRTDAALYVRSIEMLYELRKLSCDYSEAFADAAMDGTFTEKVIRLFDKAKDDDYKDFLEQLTADKQNVLMDEQQMVLAPLFEIWAEYPDVYESRYVNGMSVEEYIETIQDYYVDEINEVPDKYAADDMFDFTSGKTYKKKDRDKKKDGDSGGKAADNDEAGSGDHANKGGDDPDDQGNKAADTGKNSGNTASDKLFDAFLNNEIPAETQYGDSYYFKDLQDPSMGMDYAEGPRLDLDNDGEPEQVITGFYGGMYLDASDGKVTVFAEGWGTAGVLDYGYYEGHCLICHKDTSHVGRNYYQFDLYEGADKLVESFTLAAEYWDSPNQNHYDENSTFTFKGETITMEEYEALLREIWGQAP